MRRSRADKWRPETLICRVNDRWTNAVLKICVEPGRDRIRQGRVVWEFPWSQKLLRKWQVKPLLQLAVLFMVTNHLGKLDCCVRVVLAPRNSSCRIPCQHGLRQKWMMLSVCLWMSVTCHRCGNVSFLQ